MKAAPANGVDFLLRPLLSQVAEVRDDDQSVIVDPPNHGILQALSFVVVSPWMLFTSQMIVCGLLTLARFGKGVESPRC